MTELDSRLLCRWPDFLVGSTIKSRYLCTLTSWYPSWYYFRSYKSIPLTTNWANQSLLCPNNAEHLARKRQVSILSHRFDSTMGSNRRSPTCETSALTIWLPRLVSTVVVCSSTVCMQFYCLNSYRFAVPLSENLLFVVSLFAVPICSSSVCSLSVCS